MGPKKTSIYLRAGSLTSLVFGLLVWVYVVVIQVTHPDWLPGPIAHLEVPPFSWRLDNIGMTAFVIAAVAFFVWRLEMEKAAG